MYPASPKTKKSIFEWISFLLGKVLEFIKIFVFLDIVLLVFWGLPVKLLMWSQHWHPALYVAIIVINFVYFGLSIYYVRRKNFYKDFDKKHILGILFPLMMIIALVGVGINCFAALSGILNDYGYIKFNPALNKHDFDAMMDFYAWHFMDLVPQIKVNETLHWKQRFEVDSGLGNWLLLLFKIIMVWIVIALFFKWNKWRVEEAKTGEAAGSNSPA
ncbi:MAG: hypothetical protein QM802_26480 [Agriterribacter sp.]